MEIMFGFPEGYKYTGKISPADSAGDLYFITEQRKKVASAGIG